MGYRKTAYFIDQLFFQRKMVNKIGGRWFINQIVNGRWLVNQLIERKIAGKRDCSSEDGWKARWFVGKGLINLLAKKGWKSRQLVGR